jgi:hypothetical protein
MRPGVLVTLQANLKALNLANVARNVEVLLRQAKEGGMGCEEFLLELTDAELQARAESRLHRRIKESKFGLFQLLAERHEKGSVILTTNLGFADWTQVFGDPTMTAALLDRLTHKAHIIQCSWQSERLKQSLRP